MCCSKARASTAESERLILAEDFFLHAEASADQALWQVLDKIGSALPKPEHQEIAGEALDEWRNAFRLIQGFEIQSTLLPFIQSHNARPRAGREGALRGGGGDHLP